MKIIYLTNNRYLVKVKWDQLWHLTNNPYGRHYDRVTNSQAGGYIRHKLL